MLARYLGMKGGLCESPVPSTQNSTWCGYSFDIKSVSHFSRRSPAFGKNRFEAPAESSWFHLDESVKGICSLSPHPLAAGTHAHAFTFVLKPRLQPAQRCTALHIHYCHEPGTPFSACDCCRTYLQTCLPSQSKTGLAKRSAPNCQLVRGSYRIFVRAWTNDAVGLSLLNGMQVPNTI